MNAAGGEVQSRDPRARRAGVRDADVRRGAPKHVAAARQFLHAVRATVQKTHEDVGDKFADEARAIHTGKKPDRGIHGKASKEQIDALLDDGIEVMPLPDPKLDG